LTTHKLFHATFPVTTVDPAVDLKTESPSRTPEEEYIWNNCE
jgi:hypothetical protein